MAFQILPAAVGVVLEGGGLQEEEEGEGSRALSKFERDFCIRETKIGAALFFRGSRGVHWWRGKERCIDLGNRLPGASCGVSRARSGPHIVIVRSKAFDLPRAEPNTGNIKPALILLNFFENEAWNIVRAAERRRGIGSTHRG